MPNTGYFDTVFATGGDLTPVPDPIQGSGAVSYEQGFGILYSTAVGSGGLEFPRAQHNQILNDITGAVQQLQQIPPFITTAMNGGSPFSYDAGVRVILGGVIYKSLQGSNTDTPPSSKWIIDPSFMNFGAYPGYSSNITLTASSLGAFATIDTNATVTLPQASTCQIGQTIYFEALIGGGSIACHSGDTINTGDGGGTVTSLAMKQGDTAYLVSNGSTYWTIFGGSVGLKYSNTFANSHGTSGYQRLPSGLYIQWGISTTSSGSGDVTTTFPLPFPTACQGVQLTPNTSGVGVMPDVVTISTTVFTSSLWTATGTRGAGYGAFYQAIGY